MEQELFHHWTSRISRAKWCRVAKRWRSVLHTAALSLRGSLEMSIYAALR